MQQCNGNQALQISKRKHHKLLVNLIALTRTNLLVTEYCIDTNIPLEFSVLAASDVFTHDTSTPFRFCEE